MSKEIGYGFFPGGDPRKFKPDEELCTEDEMKSWAVACAQWEIGNEVAVGSSCIVAGGMIVTISTLGIGTYEFEWDDPDDDSLAP